MAILINLTAEEVAVYHQAGGEKWIKHQLEQQAKKQTTNNKKGMQRAILCIQQTAEGIFHGLKRNFAKYFNKPD